MRGHESTAGVSDRVGGGQADRPVRTCERCCDEPDLRDGVLGIGPPLCAALKAVTCKVTALAARRKLRSGQASRDQSGQLQLVPHCSLSQHPPRIRLSNDTQPWPPAHLGNRVEQDALIAAGMERVPRPADSARSSYPHRLTEADVPHRPVNTRPQGRLGQRRARTRVIEPRNLNRFFDELIAKVGGSNPSGCASIYPSQPTSPHPRKLVVRTPGAVPASP
jgi:hypothetical protein